MKKPEYNDLLQYGIQFFRRQAGYIPPKAPPDEFHDWTVEFGYAMLTIHLYRNRYLLHKIVVLAPLCFACRRKIEDFLQADTFRIYPSEWEVCEGCGRGYYDDIPF
jgi:hypothetical protein